jgi:hypothetical protein
MKVKHWRGLPTNIGPESALVLEFSLPIVRKTSIELRLVHRRTRDQVRERSRFDPL